jgi:outer membrane protein
VLTLDEALRVTEQHQPAVRSAQASELAAQARAGQSLAALLPQVNLGASYQRSTANFAPRPGAVPAAVNTTDTASLATYDFFNFNATLSQQIYDFNQSIYRYVSQRKLVESAAQQTRNQLVQSLYTTRIAYLNARALKALVTVAQQNLENERKHLALAQAQVEVGTRPAIDVSQAKTLVANARVQLIQAQANADNAKLSLNLAMGRNAFPDFELADEPLQRVAGEEQTVAELTDEALKERADLLAIERQIASAEASLVSLRGGYAPSLNLSTGITEAGRQLDQMAFNWNLIVSLQWNVFSGLQTYRSVAEGVSQKTQLEAQRDALTQQVRVDVAQAQRLLNSAQEAIAAADEAAVAAKERLALAEGRYEAGIGNAIELGDSQVALTQTNSQRVQAEFNVASARAQLLRALGKR